MPRLSSPDPEDDFWEWVESVYVWPDDEPDTPTPPTSQ